MDRRPSTSEEDSSDSSNERPDRPAAPPIHGFPVRPASIFGHSVAHGPSSSPAESIFPAGLYIDDAAFRLTIRSDYNGRVQSPYRPLPHQEIARDERALRAARAVAREIINYRPDDPPPISAELNALPSQLSVERLAHDAREQIRRDVADLVARGLVSEWAGIVSPPPSRVLRLVRSPRNVVSGGIFPLCIDDFYGSSQIIHGYRVYDPCHVDAPSYEFPPLDDYSEADLHESELVLIYKDLWWPRSPRTPSNEPVHIIRWIINHQELLAAEADRPIPDNWVETEVLGILRLFEHLPPPHRYREFYGGLIETRRDKQHILEFKVGEGNYNEAYAQSDFFLEQLVAKHEEAKPCVVKATIKFSNLHPTTWKITSVLGYTTIVNHERPNLIPLRDYEFLQSKLCFPSHQAPGGHVR